MKRIFDIIVSGCGLLLLSPLLVVIAIWVKLDSEGPVFYRQVRVDTIKIFESLNFVVCVLDRIRVLW